MTVKKSFFKILPFLMLTALLFLAGCAVSQSEYDAVLAERDSARSQLNDTEFLNTDLQVENSALQSENTALLREIEVLEGQPVVGLPTIAEWIRSGVINVGEPDGLGIFQRYHTIHSTILDLDCVTCHLTMLTTEQEVFYAQDVALASPTPTDRSICATCHGVGGPATTLYGSEP